jgi:Protein of unknown function (DUF3024)
VGMTPSLTHLSEIDLVKIRRFAEGRIPARARYQVRLEVDVHGQTVTIVERRAPWRPDFGPEWSSFPRAQLRFNRSTHLWSLYWRDADLYWHRYDGLGPASHVEPLLAEIDADPMARFWG